MALLVGSTAPDFDLPGWYGQADGRFSLAAERGHPVVLAFYPGDERLVCTRQMCAYSDSVADLHLFDAVVWGISPQDVDSHRSFAEGRRLKMPLLSDVDREVARAYGVLGPMGLRRSVFVVAGDGRIAWRRVVSLNVLFPAVDEIRAALEDVRAAA
ncbi:MAG: peroxiredoxin [Actinomycetes bacterium]